MKEEDLIAYFDRDSFVLKTQQQIEKDFAKYGIDFHDTFVTDPLSKIEIESILQEKVTAIMKFGETNLLQLLYTIDIPEKDFLNLVQSPDFLPTIASMILKREAMKVYFREKYS
jgi:hypothetical protein